MADATDLKSVGPKCPCGFDSRRPDWLDAASNADTSTSSNCRLRSRFLDYIGEQNMLMFL